MSGVWDENTDRQIRLAHENAAKVASGSESRWDATQESPYSDARILNQIQFTRDSLTELRGAISHLEEYISPILLPKPTNGNSALDGPESKATSTLSAHIDDINSEVVALVTMVQFISKRVQL